MKKNWCTGFPEYWYQWYISKYYIPLIRRVYIGDCCKAHDEDYINLTEGDSTKPSDVKFLECLKKKVWKPVAYLMYATVRVLGRKFKGN